LLLRSYPDLAGPIRLAAVLGNQLLSTNAMAGVPSRRREMTLPRSVGPALPDGRLRYELRRSLGEGSSGQVFESVDHLLSDAGHAAKVAVKLIAVDELTIHRQAAEATKARRIEHPGVARVLDRGLTDDGELFLVYELVAGGDLQSWFEERHRHADLRVLVGLLVGIARGVQAAHSVGVVHCDLKPSNVLITPEGQPRVTDFGVAAMTDSGLELGEEKTRHLPLGNLAFAAPEQIRQSMASASPLVDVYALGGLLYYLTTGEFPNGRTAAQVLSAHGSTEGGSTEGRGPPPSIRLIRRDADERLDRICAKAMMARPEERYATAAEFANDLEAWLEGRPIAWMREGVRTRTALWVRRSPRLAAVSALCVLVVLVGAFGSGFYANVARQKEADRKQLENTVSYSRSALRLLGRTMQIARIENRSPTTAEMKKLESDMRTLGRQLRDGTIPPPEPGEFDGE
jgi:serine/threonine-protein kinase